MRLDAHHDKAAQRLADGRMTDERIAQEAGVSRMTLYTWQKDPDFAARIEQHTQTLHARLVKRGAADKQKRINGQVERLQLYWDLLAARAGDGQAALKAAGTPDEAARALRALFGKGELPPGVETGLLTKTYKQIGKVLQEEWAVDTGLLAEMRALEKQIAQELGEWTDKKDITSGGQTIGTLADILAAARGVPPGDNPAGTGSDRPLPDEPGAVLP
jgi:hypothetical protein